MSAPAAVSRRRFLKIAASGGGGLLVGFGIPGCGEGRKPYRFADDTFSPNSWIHISQDDTVTLFVSSSEMGQGAMTSLAMILADELEADWANVRVQFAPVHEDFNNPLMGAQATGGSTSVRGYWKPLRAAAAAGRELLTEAAAKTWGVPRAQCRARNGSVTHEPSKRSLRFGALVVQATKLRLSGTPPLKERNSFNLVGRSQRRLDTPAKIDGSAIFGQDVRLPGMLTAVIARAPVHGSVLRSFDAAEASVVPGVRHVIGTERGVAVVADGFWAAERGRQALTVDWELSALATLDSDDIYARLRRAVDRQGKSVRSEGDSRNPRSNAVRAFEAIYETPYLAHACMEPMNCTADVRADGCDVWIPTQAQTEALAHTARITGLPKSRIQIHTTFLGGGFGRRLSPDFLVEAVSVSKAIGRPVKIVWTREDDMRNGNFRPANCARLRGELDADGRPRMWFQRIAGPKPALGGVHMPYDIPNVQIETVEDDPGIPVGPWRSVGASQNAFAVECFIDELAHAARRDPVSYRLELLRGAPRHAGVLTLAAERADWGKPMPAGHGRGAAVYHAYAGWVAHVVEVAVRHDAIRIVRVVSAVDCGMVVNPDGVVAQTESAVVFALSAALWGEITHSNGRVLQANFPDYRLLRMDEMPRVVVHTVPSNEEPGGVGEAGVPPLAPAIANAIFAATGKRIRRLPIRKLS